ncbi:cytidylyltransferase domain-containing protein [Microbacterium sp.]|uniref:cytidylyltransferase domain-containing protein n=1 Tax=Microbacterium sp. TaxID=51671 RepID=UPI003C751311
MPLKLNNERTPGKNTRLMHDGIPMASHLLRTLAEVEEIDEVVVYCSDESIAEMVERDGATFLRRSATLDTAQTTSNDILSAFTAAVDADLYILAHATSPFLSTASVRAGITGVVSGGYDSALTVRPTRDFYWSDGRPLNYDPRRIPRTQDLPPMFIETSGYFMFRREVFTESGRRVGDRALLVTVDEIEAVDIDEEVDFAVANALLAHGLVRRSFPRRAGGEKGDARIRALVMDVDGTLTDGRITFGTAGTETKAFNVKDGFGIAQLLPRIGIVPVILTARRSDVVIRRAAELGIERVYQGVADKAKHLEELATDLDILLKQIAYVGDDLNDLEAMSVCGLTACPADAVDTVKRQVDVVLSRPGGQGAVREFIEMLSERA